MGKRKIQPKAPIEVVLLEYRKEFGYTPDQVKDMELIDLLSDLQILQIKSKEHGGVHQRHTEKSERKMVLSK